MFAECVCRICAYVPSRRSCRGAFWSHLWFARNQTVDVPSLNQWLSVLLPGSSCFHSVRPLSRMCCENDWPWILIVVRCTCCISQSQRLPRDYGYIWVTVVLQIGSETLNQDFGYVLIGVWRTSSIYRSKIVCNSIMVMSMMDYESHLGTSWKIWIKVEKVLLNTIYCPYLNPFQEFYAPTTFRCST